MRILLRRLKYSLLCNKGEVHIKGDCVHKDKAVMAEVVAKRRVEWCRMCGILTINLFTIARPD